MLTYRRLRSRSHCFVKHLKPVWKYVKLKARRVCGITLPGMHSLFQATSRLYVHRYNVTLSWMKPSLNRYRWYVYVQWPWALITRGLMMAFTFHLRIWDVETFTTLQLSHRKPVDTGNTAEHRDGTAGQRETRGNLDRCTFFVLIFVTVKWDFVGYFLTIWTSLKNREQLTVKEM